MPFENVYHIGVVVEDIEASMRQVADQVGVTWAGRRTATVTVRQDGRIAPISLEVCYSRNGPPFIELIEGQGNGVWSAAGGTRLHHIGIYVEDLAAETARLTKLGMTSEALGVGADPADLAPSLFSYMTSPFGVRLELVDAAGRDGLRAWTSGS
ncbi:MAG: VOC family protein [Dehalococcoidia bacterium]